MAMLGLEVGIGLGVMNSDGQRLLNQHIGCPSCSKMGVWEQIGLSGNVGFDITESYDVVSTQAGYWSQQGLFCSEVRNARLGWCDSCGTQDTWQVTEKAWMTQPYLILIAMLGFEIRSLFIEYANTVLLSLCPQSSKCTLITYKQIIFLIP